MMRSLAEVVRDEAIQRVDEHANDAWKARAFDAIARVARRRSTLTTDDVWAAMDGPAGTHEPRAMGPMMLSAARAGLIEATESYVKSARVTCHARPLRVWSSKFGGVAV